MEIAGFCECLAGKAFLRDARETFCFTELSFLIHTFCTHITHKCWGVLLRENPSHNHWELEIFIPIILYIIHCGFSSTPTSQFPYPWEVDSPNTYPPFQSVKWGFGVAGKHWKKPSIGRSQALADAIGRITGSGELDKTRFREALLE